MPPAHRVVAAALIGTSGISVMLAMLGPQWSEDGPFLLGNWPFILAAAIGAGCMGFLFADCFGHPGRHGLGLSAFGAVLATVFGAAVAGFGLGLTVALTPAGLFIGPMAVAQALLTSPMTLATWIGTMALAHLAMTQVRTRHPMPS